MKQPMKHNNHCWKEMHRRYKNERKCHSRDKLEAKIIKMELDTDKPMICPHCNQPMNRIDEGKRIFGGKDAKTTI